MKKKGMLFVIVVVLLAVVTGMIWNFRNKGTNYLYDQLELAQRYLLEQDYEKALEEIRKGTPGKMLLFPNAEDIRK